MEAGETDEQALHRELQEELGIDTQIGTMCFETKHGYPGREIHLRVYRAKLISGEPRAIDVNDMEWADQTKLLEKEVSARRYAIGQRARRRIGTRI